MAAGKIDRKMPWAKKVALSALTGNYPDKDAAMIGIENSVRGFYLRDLGDQNLASGSAADDMIGVLQGIYNQNIFPFMKVGWNTYPSHLGHRNDSGCFRCHNENLKDEEGQAIPYDCTLCHSILAMDSATEFQFLLPADEKDPDRKMHEYLGNEFLGVKDDVPQGYVEPELEK